MQSELALVLAIVAAVVTASPIQLKGIDLPSDLAALAPTTHVSISKRTGPYWTPSVVPATVSIAVAPTPAVAAPIIETSVITSVVTTVATELQTATLTTTTTASPTPTRDWWLTHSLPVIAPPANTPKPNPNPIPVGNYANPFPAPGGSLPGPPPPGFPEHWQGICKDDWNCMPPIVNCNENYCLHFPHPPSSLLRLRPDTPKGIDPKDLPEHPPRSLLRPDTPKGIDPKDLPVSAFEDAHPPATPNNKRSVSEDDSSALIPSSALPDWNPAWGHGPAVSSPATLLGHHEGIDQVLDMPHWDPAWGHGPAVKGDPSHLHPEHAAQHYPPGAVGTVLAWDDHQFGQPHPPREILQPREVEEEEGKLVKWRLCHDATHSWRCPITCGSENAETDGTCG